MTPTEAADYILSGGTITRQKLIECFKRLGFEVEPEELRVICRIIWPYYPAMTTLSIINYFGGEENMRCCVGRIGYIEDQPINMAAVPEMIRDLSHYAGEQQ